MPRRVMFALYERRAIQSFPNVRTDGLAQKFVMCEQLLMEQAPGTMELAEKAGISKSYASEILSGKRDRAPSRPLAIHILRRTGWRHSVIADLSDEQIAMLEAIEPWAAREQAA